MGKLRGKLRRFFNFNRPRQSFGMVMDGDTAKDLYLMVAGVAVAMVFFVITGYPYMSPIMTAFLKEELGFSDSLYGLIAALPSVTVLVQIPFSAHLQKKPKIKEYFVPILFGLRLSFLLLALMAALIRDDRLVVFTAFIFFFYGIISSLTWMTDLLFSVWLGAQVPPACSGRFFGNRQTIMSAMSLIYSLLISLITDRLADWPYKYSLLFSIAAIFGSLDALAFIFVRRPQEGYTPMPEPDAVDASADEDVPAASATKADAVTDGSHTTKPRRTALRLPRFSRHIFLPLKDPRYRSYLLFTTLYSFGLQISSPYVNVYMLEVLELSLGWQTFLATLVPGLATVLFIGFTGRVSDRYGYRNALLLFGFISAVSPLFWLMVHMPTRWLIVPINFTWGITGIATDLAIMSMSIFLAPPEQRSRYITSKAVFQSLFGIVPAILIGGFLSDILAEPLARVRWTFPGGYPVVPFHILMALALIFRTAAILIFVRQLPNDSDVSFREFLKALGESFVIRVKHPLPARPRRRRRLRVGSSDASTAPAKGDQAPTVFLDPESSLDPSILPDAPDQTPSPTEPTGPAKKH